MSTASALRLQASRKAAGLCVQCGKDSKGMVRCTRCRKMIYSRLAPVLTEQLDANKCLQCGKINKRRIEARKQVEQLESQVKVFTARAEATKADHRESENNKVRARAAQFDIDRIKLPRYCQACLNSQQQKRNQKPKSNG